MQATIASTEAEKKYIVSQLSLDDLGAHQLHNLRTALTPRTNKYIPHTPTPKQSAFLLLPGREAFFGGAAGGGKSDALLTAALQYVDVPGYSAILFRRTYADLALPGALMDRAEQWLYPWVLQKEVKWYEKDKQYVFPGGATLTFGYMENAKDKYRYQSAEFQFVGFDELTQFIEANYTYMFSRLRRLKGSDIPIRMRSASNPGGLGHEWVKRRFLIEGPSKGRIFIPATLNDNPHLDIEEYELSLQELDPITRAQLREGNWEVRHGGSLFQAQWFDIIERHQLPSTLRLVRHWDLAASEPSPKRQEPDWTAGCLLGEHKGIFYILDMQRFQKRPQGVEEMIRQTAKIDGYTVRISMEQEPGASGVNTIDHYARNILKGYSFMGYRSTGSKVLRANPVSSAAEAGRVKIVRGRWNYDFLEEATLFPNGLNDDQVDALSGAFTVLRDAPRIYEVPLTVGVGGGSYWRGERW